MKLSRTAIKELTAAYRAVLKHAFIAMVGTMIVIGGASADDEKTQIKVETGETMELAAGQVYDGYTTTGKGAVASVDGTLTVGSNSIFSNNKSEYIGGAIVNSGTLNIGNNTKFIGNTAIAEDGSLSGGGALFSFGGAVNINEGTLFENNLSYLGGAIVNYGGKLTANKTIFRKNIATEQGGAIDVEDGNIEINDSIFVENNGANYGGAISSVWNPDDGHIDIKGTEFTGNSAGVGGAIGAYKFLTVSNSMFKGNYTTANGDGGGAIVIGGHGKVDIADTIFDGNRASIGGAIATRPNTTEGVARGDDATNEQNKDGHWLTIANTVFKNNVADAGADNGNANDYNSGSFGDGGAIWNGFVGSTVDGVAHNNFITNTSFENNIAKNSGGAIYNEGINQITDSAFTGNIASKDGGAIFNAAIGKLTFDGNNVFSGNMAGGVANDIHNMGALTVAGGTTTIDGGITGTGTLTVADGATLNIGTATVEQGTLYLDGTVGLTIVDANNYGKLLANTYADDATTGRVSLTVATTGTYKIFNEGVNYTIVDAGAIYDVSQDDLGTGWVIISTKSVDKIAADTGLTDTAASTVAGLANSNNELANIASMNVQQALRDGDTEYVERETARANPMNKPVVQSVAQSVQGQVATMAANRMSGMPTMGRNGGDINADYGVWAQGMFNKSKFNGQFNGYTRGIAAGIDALVDNQYTVGLGYAFGHSDINADDGRNTEIDSNSIFAYAQYKPSDWYINATLNYTMSKYTGSHDAFGVNLKSDYDVNAFGAQAMTGYDFASGVTPEAGVRYLHVAQDSYNNGLAHVDGDDTDFLTGVAGLKYRFAIENGAAVHWFPELRAAATYDFVSDRAMSTVTMPGAAAYVVDGDRLSRFGGEFGIGLTAEYNGVEISLNYDLDLHEDYTSQTGMLKFRYEF